jgi:hypothetical protein
MPRDSSTGFGYLIGTSSSSASSSSSDRRSIRRPESSLPSPYVSNFSHVPKIVPKCTKDGALPFFALGSRGFFCIFNYFNRELVCLFLKPVL